MTPELEYLTTQLTAAYNALNSCSDALTKSTFISPWERKLDESLEVAMTKCLVAREYLRRVVEKRQ